MSEPRESKPASDGLSRARADLDAGREWKARDRLVGMLNTRQDHSLLDLLAQVHWAMRDLPAAGALWSVTGRDDESAREAIEAWHERYPNAESRTASLPRALRQTPEQKRRTADERSRKAEAKTRWMMGCSCERTATAQRYEAERWRRWGWRHPFKRLRDELRRRLD